MRPTATTEPRPITDDPRRAYVSYEEVSAYLGITRQTLKAWVEQQKFPAPIKLNRKAVRFRVDDIRRWEDDRPRQTYTAEHAAA